MGPHEAIALLAATTGRRYELDGELIGGETGAHRVLGPRGEPLVVKWAQDERSQQLRAEGVVFSERLRTVGEWPVPRERTVHAGGALFVLQEFMAGAPVTAMTRRLVEQFLALHSQRVDLARPSDAARWPSSLITTLTEGGSGYCRHDSLRDYDHRTAELLMRIQRFGSSLREGDLAGTDVIHWDLHPGNLLEGERGLSAIVDTDFAMIGDSNFDLVMLALTSRAMPSEAGVQARLSAVAFGRLESIRTQAYLAHLFLRLLDWPIRRGAPMEIEFWLEQADLLLDI
jgi:aminoglycoside phosphotransferase (APT) family kinase protein